MLIPFGSGLISDVLCTSTYIPIAAGRMGNQKRALKLIINELQDVDKVKC